jgi:hypothetical protein
LLIYPFHNGCSKPQCLETPGVKLVGHLEVLRRVNHTSFTKVEQTVIEKPVLLSFQGFVMPYDIVG